MSNKQSNNIFAGFNRLFGQSELEESPQVEVLGCKYYVQAQALKVIRDGKNLILDTRVMLLEKPQYTSIPVIVGYLKSFHQEQTGLWNTPEFVAEVENSAEFLGDQGYEYVQKRISDLTQVEISRAVYQFIGKGRQTRPHILKMCALDLLRNQVLCLYETEPIELFEPPKYYHWYGVLYELSRQREDHEWVYALYYPVGAVNHV